MSRIDRKLFNSIDYVVDILDIQYQNHLSMSCLFNLSERPLMPYWEIRSAREFYFEDIRFKIDIISQEEFLFSIRKKLQGFSIDFNKFDRKLGVTSNFIAQFKDFIEQNDFIVHLDSLSYDVMLKSGEILQDRPGIATDTFVLNTRDIKSLSYGGLVFYSLEHILDKPLYLMISGSNDGVIPRVSLPALELVN